MCRLYGFIATHPRKVSCELIQSQNSLLAQSKLDERGLDNSHGWGLGAYKKKQPYIVKQAEPASESEDFRWTAAETHSQCVISHVRRATVGIVKLENTHPFGFEEWIMAHNGDIGNFDKVRPKMLNAMPPIIRQQIAGDTDSEHIFYFIMSLYQKHPETPIATTIRTGILQLKEWAKEANATVAINLLFSNGKELIGTRHGPSLSYVKRENVHPCQVCGGATHIDPDCEQSTPYQAVAIASEPITTNEKWVEVPQNSILWVNENMEFSQFPID